MEDEIKNFIKVWLSVFATLCYCYVVGKIIPKGTTRLLSILPIVCFFLALPLNLSSIHLGGTTAFFISWLGNFKLLLFAFGRGPLSSDPSITLGRFVALACLPIKIQQKQYPPPKSPPNLEKPLNGQSTKYKGNPSPQPSKKGPKSSLNYTIKALLLATLVRVYDYSDYLHPKLILVLYCFHIYFCLEILLAMVAALARALLGMELEPQFDEPYLSSSLQDFWGRRWNVMVSSILRPTVYDPVLYISTRIMGRRWAPLPAVLGTFVVSALMHELIIYYLGRTRPTWEITWFFLLHGAFLMAEIALKKGLKDRWRLPRSVSGPLTVVLVMGTGFWLFFPPLLRCKTDVRAFQEIAAASQFVKDVAGWAFTFKPFNATS